MFKTYTSKNQLGLPTLHHRLMDALISPSLVVFQCLATWSWRSLFHMLTKGPQKQLNVLKSAMAMFQKNLLLFSIFQIDQNIMQTKGGHQLESGIVQSNTCLHKHILGSCQKAPFGET